MQGVGHVGYYLCKELVRLGDDEYRIDLAVAGFGRDEIDITAQQNVLLVSGRKTEENGQDFIHRGIATRSFERRFALADHIKVTGADLKDGLLAIELDPDFHRHLCGSLADPRLTRLGRTERYSVLAGPWAYANLGVPVALATGRADARQQANALGAALIAQWRRRDPLMRGMSFACIMGVTSILIHSWVDFNLQIPANAAFFMVLLALGWISLYLDRREGAARTRNDDA